MKVNKKTFFTITFFFFMGNYFAQLPCFSLFYHYDGYCYDYHSNGKIARIKEFKEGFPTGIWMSFDENGNLISQLNTRDKQDSLAVIYAKELQGFNTYIEKIRFQQTKYNEAIICFEDENASFRGGKVALAKWVSENIVYPDEAKEFGEHGTVHVSFFVEADGSITQVTIEKGVSLALDREVKRLIGKMPRWLPTVVMGEKVRSKCRIPIKFSIN